MSHGADLGAVTPLDQPASPLAPLAWILSKINRLVMGFAMLGLLAAACILTSSVVLRYFLKIPTDWQDEASVFLLVGVTFMCGAELQSRRGHIGIQAISTLLSPGVNRVRLAVCDFLSCAFCLFFAWKSWTLFNEAWVDGLTTSSTWGPPLWVPYSLMSIGMSLLTLQLALQFVSGALKGGAR